ncbi:hypothetical protein CWS02_13965 [Enterobacter sp. EA-1]|nr:hypothetical protein CWS02_13965 [Enterobacter sp. EA-1]
MLLPEGIREPARASARFTLRFADFYQEAVDLSDSRELTVVIAHYADILPDAGVKAAQDLLFVLHNADFFAPGGPCLSDYGCSMTFSALELLQSLPLVVQLRANVAAIITASGYWQMAETVWEATQQINGSVAPISAKFTQIAALLLRQRSILSPEWQAAVDVISRCRSVSPPCWRSPKAAMPPC